MLPANVNMVLLVPVQTVAAPEIVPDTDLGFTVTETESVMSELQAPLDTTAL